MTLTLARNKSRRSSENEQRWKAAKEESLMPTMAPAARDAASKPIFAVLRRTDYKIESDEPLSIVHIQCARSPLKDWIRVFLNSGSITLHSLSFFFYGFPDIHHYQIIPFCIQFAHSPLHRWIWVVLPKARRVSEKHSDAQKVSRKDTTTRQLARSPLKL